MVQSTGAFALKAPETQFRLENHSTQTLSLYLTFQNQVL